MSIDQHAPPAPQSPASPAPAARRLGAVAGLLAGVLTLGIAELVAALVGRASSPVVVVGGAFVDLTPRWLKEFAIRQFGENDKQVLIGGILLTLAVLAAVLGVLAVRRPLVGYVGVALLGVMAAGIAVTRPVSAPLDALPSLVGALAGIAALFLLLGAAVPAGPAPDKAGSPVRPGMRARFMGGDRKGALNRRGFLVVSLGTASVAVAAGGIGRALRTRLDVSASRAAVRLPAPASAAPALPAGVDLGIDGVTPFTTPIDSFYRVDTALVVPQVRAEEWTLRIHGMVDREMTLDFAELLSRPLLERDVTLTCVSNEVGGTLLGHARWLGASLADLLAEAGVQSGATQLVSRSVDGMTIGTPVSTVMDGRDAMLAVGMGGKPLPAEHGFPVRMIVPGLYGYVSACKWITEIEVTTFDAYDAYWVERGWAEEAEIRTSSRIDTPKPFARVRPGQPVAVAGVAWAQHRGIERVEVRVDGGAWQEARLAAEANEDTWRQWVWEWTPEDAGSHTLDVRATDANGTIQEQERRTPFPSGSTGWHNVVVTAQA